MNKSIYLDENGNVRRDIIEPRAEGFDYEAVVYSFGEARCNDSYFVTPLDLEAEPVVADLVEGLISKNSMAVVYGPSGVGKSFLALDMALTIASGLGSWHGRGTESGSVVYIAGEGSGGLQKRICAWQLANGVQAKDCQRLFLRKWAVDLLEPNAIQELANEIAVRSDLVKLIVIDTLARCFGPGDENAARDMNLFVQHLDLLRQKTGATILVVHHTGKEATRGARGSTALQAAADTMLEVQSSGKHVSLTCKKQKDGEAFNPIRFQMVGSGESIIPVLATNQAVKNTTSSAQSVVLNYLASAAPHQGALKQDICGATGLQSKPVQRALSELVSAGLITHTGSRNSPSCRYYITLQGEDRLRFATQQRDGTPFGDERSIPSAA